VPGDAERIAEEIGETVATFRNSLQLEQTPEGKYLVRMKPECRFLRGNECSIQEFKPKGGRDFKCWDMSTHALTYFWSAEQVRAL
jgi:hypothetical protein